MLCSRHNLLVHSIFGAIYTEYKAYRRNGIVDLSQKLWPFKVPTLFLHHPASAYPENSAFPQLNRASVTNRASATNRISMSFNQFQKRL